MFRVLANGWFDSSVHAVCKAQSWCERSRYATNRHAIVQKRACLKQAGATKIYWNMVLFRYIYLQ